MLDQVRLLCIYAVLVGLALGPAILTALVIRYPTGVVHRLALPTLLIGLMATPYVLLASELYDADHSASIDAGGFVIVGIVTLMGLVLISALIGIVVGTFLLRRHREWQSENGPMFWMTKDSL